MTPKPCDSQGSILKTNPRRLVVFGLLLGIVVLGGFLRGASLNWDEGALQHPDERFLVSVVGAIRPAAGWSAFLDTAASPLNPNNVGFSFYVYGTLPLYLLKSAASFLNITGMAEITLLGRQLAAGFATATLPLVFLTGRALYGSTVGLIAAFLFAVMALPIQMAHFFVVDTFGVFFGSAALWCAVHISRDKNGPDARWAAAFGLLLGLAAACKIDHVALGVTLPLALLARRGGGCGGGARRSATAAAIAALVFLGCFRLAQPYAFSGPGLFGLALNPRWLESIREQVSLASGAVDFPPYLQWARRPFWYSGWQFVAWALGPPLGIAAVAAFFAMGRRLFRGREREHLLLWGFILLILTRHFLTWNPMIRYLLPITPGLAVIAAWGVAAAWEHCRRFARPWRMLACGVGVALGATTLAWAWAVSGIHTTPHTRLAATRWIHRVVPAGAVIAGETPWDDSLPLPRGDNRDSGTRYNRVSLDITDPDTETKRVHLVKILDQAGWIVSSSSRQWGSLPRIPERYPLSIAFYRDLLGIPAELTIAEGFRTAKPGQRGPLGFEVAAVFRSDPTLGCLKIDDQGAEESFTVYDHPLVVILKKSKDYSPERVRERLGQIDLSKRVVLPPRRYRTVPADVMLPTERLARQRSYDIWRDIFASGGSAHRSSSAAALLWYALVSGLGLLAWPLVRRILPGAADRGYPLGRIAGLLGAAFIVWLCGSFGVPMTRTAMVLLVATLAAVFGAVAWRDRHGLAAEIMARRRYLLVVEGLALSLFMLGLALRWFNPDLWHPMRGGEKPMELAILGALMRSISFPPYDPWMAGGYLNYYYFGFLFTAIPAKILGIAPATAFNLGIATLVMLIPLGAFSAAWNLEAARCRGASPGKNRHLWVAGAAGALLVATAGNLSSTRMALAEAARRLSGSHPLYSQADWYWLPSRVIPGRGDVPPITEFPAFSLLFADLHPHLIALPLTLLALVWVISLLAPAMGGGRCAPDRERAIPLLLGGALVIGSLRVVNTWDFPLYLFLGTTAVWFRSTVVRRDPAPARALSTCAVFVAAALAFFQPFFSWYNSGYGRPLLWLGPRTPLDAYVTHWGLLMFLAAGGFAVALHGRLRPLQLLDRRLHLLLALVGFGVTGLVEVVVLEGDIGRMNTVFKFYFQAWTLLAVAGAVSFVSVLEAAASWSAGARWMWRFATVLLAASALTYPLLAVPARIRDRMAPQAPRTLDGSAFLQDAVLKVAGRTIPLRDDAAAANWLSEHGGGTPVIVEAATPDYQWGSRIAVQTGLPAVVGWSWHQQQQRRVVPSGWVTERVAAVRAFYETTRSDEAVGFLRRYRVGFIVVGEFERSCYDPAGMTKFEEFEGLLWREVFRQGKTVIYSVPEMPL